MAQIMCQLGSYMSGEGAGGVHPHEMKLSSYSLLKLVYHTGE